MAVDNPARVVSSDADLAAAFKVRHAVFVLEQGVPEHEEMDTRDRNAVHIVAVNDDDRVVGTCRLLQDDTSVARVGRMAVLPAFRGRNFAERMLDLAERHAAAAGATSMVLDSQLTARGFYERAGYVAHGPVFMDAGIEHVAMSKQLKPG